MGSIVSMEWKPWLGILFQKLLKQLKSSYCYIKTVFEFFSRCIGMQRGMKLLMWRGNANKVVSNESKRIKQIGFGDTITPISSKSEGDLSITSHAPSEGYVTEHETSIPRSMPSELSHFKSKVHARSHDILSRAIEGPQENKLLARVQKLELELKNRDNYIGKLKETITELKQILDAKDKLIEKYHDTYSQQMKSEIDAITQRLQAQESRIETLQIDLGEKDKIIKKLKEENGELELKVEIFEGMANKMADVFNDEQDEVSSDTTTLHSDEEFFLKGPGALLVEILGKVIQEADEKSQ
ncbi:uncharacterized protein VTP21DRAFT_9860 [Calcarisporiella thermophila]|uniref:uncharacterized protein n=1 Tax=Calcarisporiella thermophila TaxID=911321 RepID=UPI003744A693